MLLNEVLLKSARTILAFLIMIKELTVKATIIESPFSHILINLLIIVNFNHKLHQLSGAKCLEVALNEAEVAFEGDRGD